MYIELTLPLMFAITVYKMKNLILLILLVFISLVSQAQRRYDYYEGQKIPIDEGMVLKISVDEYTFSILNEIDEDHGSLRPASMDTDEWSLISIWNMNFMSNDMLLYAFHDALTTPVLKRFTFDEKFTAAALFLTFDRNGNIMSVAMAFHADPVVFEIPPENYAKLLRNLQEYVKFHIKDRSVYINSAVAMFNMKDVADRKQVFPTKMYGPLGPNPPGITLPEPEE